MSSHRCKACLIFCMDFRLNEHLAAFLAQQELDRDGADIIRVAGAAKNLARPHEERDRHFLIEQLQTSHELHGVRQFYIINHEDCGAYGPENITDSEEELTVHGKDLRSARTLLQERFPSSEVLTYFMWLNGRADRID
jgi:carbonic anhydrase